MLIQRLTLQIMIRSDNDFHFEKKNGLVIKVQPESFFIFSDEEEEDPHILLYLPVSPDIDEPEEGAQGDQVKDWRFIKYNQRTSGRTVFNRTLLQNRK